MWKLIFLVLVFIFCVTLTATGEITTTVYLSDGNTPLELADPCVPHVYRDIMVGTELVIVVSSDTNEYWGDENGDGGYLAIEEEYWPYGILSARGPLVEGDWSGSHLPAAGNPAKVYDLEEYPVDGFDLYPGPHDIEAGDWFIIDYNAIEIGNCNVGFYDYRISWDIPIYHLAFSHVRTRDFNNDSIVNFRDYSILASYWQERNCNALDGCEGTDLDTNGSVNVNDLMLFCQYWLERTQ